MTDVFGEVQRDRYGRPLIVPPDGGKAVPYTRCSTFAKALDTGEGLIDWSAGMALIGAAKSDTVVRAARTLTWDNDKRRVRELVEQAKTLAGAGDKATEGTTLHHLTELADTGRAVPDDLDATTRADLDAYAKVTAGLTTLHAEAFVVCDPMQVAGTLDRIVQVEPVEWLPEWLHGRRPVVDLKTGSVEYAVGAYAIQLAVYARGKFYDSTTHGRTDTGADPDVGLLVHLPQRTGVATLYAINLAAGWSAAQVAKAARDWRTNAKLSNTRFTSDVITKVHGVGVDAA